MLNKRPSAHGLALARAAAIRSRRVQISDFSRQFMLRAPLWFVANQAGGTVAPRPWP